MKSYVFPECPVKRTEEILVGKWTIRILLLLLDGTKGFNELQKFLEGISAKVLSGKLKFLQERGIVKKKSYETNPVTTFYLLTKKGEDFQLVIDTMVKFGIDLEYKKC